MIWKPRVLLRGICAESNSNYLERRKYRRADEIFHSMTQLAKTWDMKIENTN